MVTTKKIGYSNDRFVILKKITSDAKKIRLKNPAMQWKDAVKKAGALYRKDKPVKKISGLKPTPKKTIKKKLVKKAAPKKMIKKPVVKKKTVKKVIGSFSKLSGVFDTKVINDIDSLKKEYFNRKVGGINDK